MRALQDVLENIAFCNLKSSKTLNKISRPLKNASLLAPGNSLRPMVRPHLALTAKHRHWSGQSLWAILWAAQRSLMVGTR